MKQCIKCLQFKEETEFSVCGKYKDKIYRRGNCKNCGVEYNKRDDVKARAKKYRETSGYKKWRKEYRELDHVKRYNQQYEELNREVRNEQRKIRHRRRYKNDIMYRLTHICRTRTKELLRIKGWTKNNKFAEYIGCSKEELVKHIESQFTTGMNWDNQGRKGWHIDHIIPLDTAKTEEELYKLCHYSNLQPLWAIDNLKKSNKI